MGILKLADFAEKNAKRIRILKTVGLADFAEKNARRMGIELGMLFELAIAIQCSFFCFANPKTKESAKCHCFSNVFEKTFAFTKCSLRSLKSLPASGAEGLRNLGSLPFSEDAQKDTPLLYSKSHIHTFRVQTLGRLSQNGVGNDEFWGKTTHFWL